MASPYIFKLTLSQGEFMSFSSRATRTTFRASQPFVFVMRNFEQFALSRFFKFSAQPVPIETNLFAEDLQVLLLLGDHLLQPAGMVDQ